MIVDIYTYIYIMFISKIAVLNYQGVWGNGVLVTSSARTPARRNAWSRPPPSCVARPTACSAASTAQWSRGDSGGDRWRPVELKQLWWDMGKIWGISGKIWGIYGT